MTILAISTNHAVRTITQIMMNGARFSRTVFPVHEGFMIQLRSAYDKKSEDTFLSVVQTYLEQAVGHVPHAARKEDIPELMSEVKLLLHNDDLYEHSEEKEGLAHVGRYILAQAHAPIDRF